MNLSENYFIGIDVQSNRDCQYAVFNESLQMADSGWIPSNTSNGDLIADICSKYPNLYVGLDFLFLKDSSCGARFMKCFHRQVIIYFRPCQRYLVLYHSRIFDLVPKTCLMLSLRQLQSLNSLKAAAAKSAVGMASGPLYCHGRYQILNWKFCIGQGDKLWGKKRSTVDLERIINNPNEPGEPVI
jgi:hypothetical protein